MAVKPFFLSDSVNVRAAEAFIDSHLMNPVFLKNNLTTDPMHARYAFQIPNRLNEFEFTDLYNRYKKAGWSDIELEDDYMGGNTITLYI